MAAINACSVDPELAPWFKGARTFDEVEARIGEVLNKHIRFLNGLSRTTRHHDGTGVIGNIVDQAVSRLKEADFLAADTLVILTIDQLEQLIEYASLFTNDGGTSYPMLFESIDTAIHVRRSSIHFRLGTRPYAWKPEKAELKRDYERLAIDDVLRNKEHSSGLFESLAKDVFRRRMRAANIRDLDCPEPLRAFLGTDATYASRVEFIGGKQRVKKKVLSDKSLDPTQLTSLATMAETSLFDAFLQRAWLRQRQSSSTNDPDSRLADSLEPGQWWLKERGGIAALQIAAAAGQRVPMFGPADLIALSGQSLLAFATICQCVWLAWSRDRESAGQRVPINVDMRLQDDGFRRAGQEWYDRLCQDSFYGQAICELFDRIGPALRNSMVKDTSMSYPGETGSRSGIPTNRSVATSGNCFMKRRSVALRSSCHTLRRIARLAGRPSGTSIR